MRKSFDGLMAIIRDVYELDPYANAVYLFCGRDSRKLKALHFDKDGFVLLQKRLDGSGRFQKGALTVIHSLTFFVQVSCG